MFPLKNFKYKIPFGDHLGAFGVRRKHDIHTGVDLYCKEGDEVVAMEDGMVMSVENFTGESAGSPWWNETKAVLILSSSGVILYGEIEPLPNIKRGMVVQEGDVIGHVIPVLKLDKGVVPSINMLHIELYTQKTKESVIWKLDEPKPDNLRDITNLLQVNLDSNV